MFHGQKPRWFQNVTWRPTVDVGSVTYPANLSGQDTGENLERFFFLIKKYSGLAKMDFTVSEPIALILQTILNS